MGAWWRQGECSGQGPCITRSISGSQEIQEGLSYGQDDAEDGKDGRLEEGHDVRQDADGQEEDGYGWCKEDGRKEDEGQISLMEKKPPLGSGERYKQLVDKLEKQGAKNPRSLAAYIGRKKYGKKKFQQLAEQGRKDG